MLDLHFTKKKIALCYDMGAVKLGMFICLFVTFDACLLNKCGKYLIFSPIDAQLLGQNSKRKYSSKCYIIQKNIILLTPIKHYQNVFS